MIAGSAGDNVRQQLASKYANIGYREGRLYREGGSRGGLVNTFTAWGENLPTGRIVTQAGEAGGRNGKS